jgi:hypothetical protein
MQQVPGPVQILHLVPVFPLRQARKPLVPQLAPLDLRLQSYIAKEQEMLYTICVILLVLWALGMATSYTASGLIHILLVVAVVVMLIRLFQGRRAV